MSDQKETKVIPIDFTLSKADQNNLTSHNGSTEHDIIRALNMYNFNVGDVVMGQMWDYDYNDQKVLRYFTETGTEDFPQRWVVMHKDESGPWVKTLNSKTGQPTGSLLNFVLDIVISDSYGYDDYDSEDMLSSKFFVDPDFVDAQLLGHSYSITEMRARFEQNIKNVEAFNKGLEVQVDSLKEMNDFILQHKNSRLYHWEYINSYTFDQEDISDEYVEFMDIKNVTVVPFDELDDHNENYSYDEDKLKHMKSMLKKYGKSMKTKEVLYIEYVDESGDDCETYSYELFDVHLFNSLPKHKHEEI